MRCTQFEKEEALSKSDYIDLSNFLFRRAFESDNQLGTFKCKCTGCKTCPFISNTVKISGPNRSAKATDHLTCISVNVICCISCTLDVRRSKQAKQGEDWQTTFASTYEMNKKRIQMSPNQLCNILIFLITPTSAWLFAGYPYTTGTKKAEKILNKNSSFNWYTLSTWDWWMPLIPLIYSKIALTIFPLMEKVLYTLI